MIKNSDTCSQKIPQEMQTDCDEIYPAILVDTYYGNDAERRFRQDISPFRGIILGPQPQDKNGK